MEMIKYDELNDLVAREVNKVIEKGSLDPAQVKVLTEALCMQEKALSCRQKAEENAMLFEDGGYSEMYSGRSPRMGMYRDGSMPADGGASYRRGRSMNTGRFISRDPYDTAMSGHSIEDRMIASLEAMADEAKSDYEFNMIQEEIRSIRSRMK